MDRTTRRQVLQRFGVGGLTLTVGGTLLQACGGGDEDAAPSSGGGQSFEGQTLVVTAYGGTWAEFMQKHQIPDFEEKTGAKVKLATGQSSVWFSKMQAAGKDNPPYDVWVNAETNTAALRKQGFFVALPEDKVPNLANVMPELRREDGIGVLGLVSPLGMVYRSDKIDKPESWLDLAKHGKQVGLLASTNGGGPQQVLKFAEIIAGDPKKWQAGMQWMSENLGEAKQVGFSAEMNPLLTQGEVVIGCLDSGDYAEMKKNGVPVDFIEPKEGWAGMYEQDMCVTAGSDVKDLGFAFIDHYLSADIQKRWVDGYNLFPANQDVEITGEAKELIPVSRESIKRIPRWDYDWLNSGPYQEILDAWNKSMSS